MYKEKNETEFEERWNDKIQFEHIEAFFCYVRGFQFSWTFWDSPWPFRIRPVASICDMIYLSY